MAARPPKTKRTKRPVRSDTVQQLLESAAVEIAEHGYEGANVASIARRAGFTVGAVYANFVSKDELFHDMIEYVLRDSLPAPFSSDPENAPKEIAFAMAKGFSTADQRLFLEICAAALRSSRIAEAVHAQLAVRTVRMREQLKSEQLRLSSDDRAAMIYSVHAMAIGASMLHALGYPDPDRDAWIKRIEAVLTTRD